MLMSGDINKLIERNINPVFETAFARIKALEDKVKALEEEAAQKPPKPSTKKADSGVNKAA